MSLMNFDTRDQTSYHSHTGKTCFKGAVHLDSAIGSILKT